MQDVLCMVVMVSVHLSLAKATFDAISKTYSYLTPDLWKETVFTKSPYQVNKLMKCQSEMGTNLG